MCRRETSLADIVFAKLDRVVSAVSERFGGYGSMKSIAEGGSWTEIHFRGGPRVGYKHPDGAVKVIRLGDIVDRYDSKRKLLEREIIEPPAGYQEMTSRELMEYDAEWERPWKGIMF